MEITEVIVKYHGSLGALYNMGIRVDVLYGGFAILTMLSSQVELVRNMEEIEYLELPSRFYYEQLPLATESCFYGESVGYDGGGVLFAVLDSGLQLENPEFLDETGQTRVRFLYDVEEEQIWSAEEINRLLESGETLLPGRDVSGHGTAVTGIAAGSKSGFAKKAELLIVKLSGITPDGFPGTTAIMRGATFAMEKALELSMPLVMNVSFGNTYGAHDGNSILEQYLDTLAQMGRCSIVVGAGNEGDTDGHAYVGEGDENIVSFFVGSYEQSLSVQMWYAGEDVYEFSMVSPDGSNRILSREISGGRYRVSYPGSDVYVSYYDATPYRTKKELYLELFGVEDYITPGEWKILVRAVAIKSGGVNCYLPAQEGRSVLTRFLNASPLRTITIPATASRVISVGAYDGRYNSYASFSGRGYVLSLLPQGELYAVKPDIAAPGVALPAPNVYGEETLVTGTSFATPVVSAAAVLLMQAGIVEGRDRVLYGEKLKALLCQTATPVAATRLPDDRVGYGFVCVESAMGEMNN